jgi:hypothetical protein
MPWMDGDAFEVWLRLGEVFPCGIRVARNDRAREDVEAKHRIVRRSSKIAEDHAMSSQQAGRSSGW